MNLKIFVVLVLSICAPSLTDRRGQHRYRDSYDLENDRRSQPTYGEGHYRSAAVATTSTICSQVGKDIMDRLDGNAVDAAVATLACLGVDTFQSSGIGGDSIWTYYERKTSKVYNIIARSKAPLASNSTMYVNRPGETLEGGLSVAVPGELLGSWEAHQRFGRLPWKVLLQPAIKYAELGFKMEKIVYDSLQTEAKSGIFERWPLLKSLLTDPKTRTWHKVGDTIKLPLLANTLQRIADYGASEFYTGALADDIVEEIQNAGGIITKEDLRQYTVEWATPLRLNLHGNYTMFSPPLPSGGPVLQYILNILNGYKMSPKDIYTYSKTITTYHRFMEAYKHAYGARSQMGSPDGETPDFVEQMKQLVAKITSPKYGEEIRAKIRDDRTFNYTEYDPQFAVQQDHGTSHVSVLGPNGDAVGVTSTINTLFASKLVGHKTGILYNNMMDDFSVPGVVNKYGVRPSPANFIKPGKRPLSSMSPSIVVNQKGMPVLVVGCAGGTRIISTNAFLTGMTLWLGEGIKSAIDAPRLHHQLYPNEIKIQWSPTWLIEGMQSKGHSVVDDTFISKPIVILQRRPGEITTYVQGFVVDGF